MSQATAKTTSTDGSLDACRPQKRRFSGIRRYLSTWPRRAAAVVVIVLLVISGYQVTAQAFKLPMINFQPEIMDKYSKVGTWDEIISTLDVTDYPKTLEHIYVPGVVADGYEEVDNNLSSKLYEVYYENRSGETYQYFQNTIDASTFIDTELKEAYEIEVNNNPGFYVLRKDSITLWWFDYQYTYQVVGNLDLDKLLVIAESLHELDNSGGNE